MGRKKKEVLTNTDDINQAYIDAIKNISTGSYTPEVGTLEDLESVLIPTGYVPSGDDYLDFIVSNRKHGGFPLGKYINIYSEEGVGKSLLVAKLIANVQKMGGRAIYFDTERSAYPPFMEVLGVQKDKLVYVSKVNTVEKILETITAIITNYIKKGADYPFLIAIDSMTMVQTEKGSALDDWSGEDAGYGEGALKQKLLGIGLKKIHNLIKQDKIMFVTTDQVRDNFEKTGKFDRKTTDTSGWAQKYYADIRIELRRALKIKIDNEHVGNKVKADVTKNRIAPAYRHSFLYLYNTRGLDNYASWIENSKLYGIMKAKGATIEVSDVNGEKLLNDEGKMPDKKFIKKKLRVDEEFRNFLYEKIAEKMIREYEAYSEAQFEDLEDSYEEESDDGMKSNTLKVQEIDNENEEEN